MTGCSGGSASNASTATENSGGFDFEGNTPLGEVIPASARESAPDFDGELLDGTAFESSELAGSITVVNFWGSWCAPCRVETPEFQAVYADVAQSDVRFLGVDVKDNRQLAQAFVDSVGAEYPSLFDPRGEVALAFRGFPANVVPSTILIDRAGQVAAVYVAVVPEDDLRQALDTLMAEEAPR
ncbi:TlpA disulfide reductase family protein [Blastococcus sp. LR1]|uniref:TlpA family protein disulfide reductase n=1 Tax=Blastococcus sp. LR1 TaxID=2877000 RepID=UPI001CCB9D1A|nr:TlpA disulfide reductase family protein [Blastococcus sp. LR1]MCA0143825.1 TlpA family protein disulfide reductase [Blastococcus sp. LR1]